MEFVCVFFVWRCMRGWCDVVTCGTVCGFETGVGTYTDWKFEYVSRLVPTVTLDCVLVLLLIHSHFSSQIMNTPSQSHLRAFNIRAVISGYIVLSHHQEISPRVLACSFNGHAIASLRHATNTTNTANRHTLLNQSTRGTERDERRIPHTSRP
jgi:hypothetical protein